MILSWFQTSLVPCSHHSIGVSKQMIISHCLMAPSLSNILMNASLLGYFFVKTVTLDPKYNLPCFYSAFSWAKFRLFHKWFEKKYDHWFTREHLIFANIVVDSEGEEDDSHDDNSTLSVFPDVNSNNDTLFLPAPVDGSISKGKSNTAHMISQELPEPDDLTIAHVDNQQAELLRWHYRLNHLTFGVLQILAKMGMLPRRLTQARVPKCSAWIFGAKHKWPWHSHENVWNIRPIVSIIAPGQYVSDD